MTAKDLLENEYFRLEEAADGVYAAIINAGMGAMGNAGIIDLGDQTIVFDTFYTPQAAGTLRSVAERLFDRPVTFVVNSHFHSDHVLGNQAFATCYIVSTSGTREAMGIRIPSFIEFAKAHPDYQGQLDERVRQEQNDAVRKELEVNLGDVRALDAALETINLRLPDVTFENELIFHGTKRVARLLTYGGGHTHSDAFLYIPNEEVAFMGDLISVENHNQFRDGDAQAWVEILDRILQLPIKKAIPGHGPVGGIQDIQIMRTYLSELLSQSRELHRDKFPMDQLSEIKIPDRYAGWAASSLYLRNIRQLMEQFIP